MLLSLSSLFIISKLTVTRERAEMFVNLSESKKKKKGIPWKRIFTLKMLIFHRNG